MKNCLAIAATLLLASCAAMGSDVPALNKLDANGDGRISREEALQPPELTAVFDRADANRDGYLDDAELQRARELIRELRERDREQDRGQTGGHQPRQH